MKSLTYMLRGVPCCLDDCIEHAGRSAPSGIEITLHSVEAYYEDYRMVRLQGTHCWVFPERTVIFETEYGGFIPDDPAKRIQGIIACINTRVRTEYGRLRQLGLPVRAGREQFTWEDDALPFTGHYARRKCV